MAKDTGQMIVHALQQGQDGAGRDPDYGGEV